MIKSKSIVLQTFKPHPIRAYKHIPNERRIQSNITMSSTNITMSSAPQETNIPKLPQLSQNYPYKYELKLHILGLRLGTYVWPKVFT